MFFNRARLTIEEARMLIETSGLSAKEWLEQALTMYEVKALQANTPHYAKDLTELEHHTTRIYELVLNMIQQSVSLPRKQRKHHHRITDKTDRAKRKGLLTLKHKHFTEQQTRRTKEHDRQQ